MVSRAIERAQAQVESQNFEIRKNVLKYDEVMNRQREVIYAWREDRARRRGEALAREWVESHHQERSRTSRGGRPRSVGWDELIREVTVLYPTELIADQVPIPRDRWALSNSPVEEAHQMYVAGKRNSAKSRAPDDRTPGDSSVIDNKWREHLRRWITCEPGIGLRAMGQRDPLVEYQREGFDLFADLVDTVKRDAVRYLFHVQVAQEAEKANRSSGACRPRRRPQAAAPSARPSPTRSAATNPVPAVRVRITRNVTGRLPDTTAVA